MRRAISGFTIVELLIVIVVIAILAAVSIVAYNGIQNRASDSIVESDMATITKKLELVKVDLGHYPQSLVEFPEFKFSKSSYDASLNNIYYIAARNEDSYAIGLRSKSGKGYILKTGVVTTGSAISASSTAAAISRDWTDSTNNFRLQGYNSGTSTWSPSWSWTN